MNEAASDTAGRDEEEAATIRHRMNAAVVRVMEYCLSDVLEVVKHANEQCEPGHRFTELLEEVVVVVKRRLLFSPRLEYFYASQLKAVQTKANTGHALNTLESKFRESQEYRAETLRAQDELIEAVEAQIKNLEMDAHDQIVAIRSKTLLDLDRMEKKSKSLQEKLQDELLEKQEFSHQMEQRHMQLELELREKRKTIEAELLATIQHYDSTMDDLQNTKNKIIDEETKTTNTLLQKLEEFSVLEAQYKQIQEERAREEERKLAAIQEEFHREHSARIIQKAWQHYKMKKMLKNAKKKGKKKKSSGKEFPKKS